MQYDPFIDSIYNMSDTDGNEISRVTSTAMNMPWYVRHGSWMIASLIWTIIYHHIVNGICEDLLIDCGPAVDFAGYCVVCFV